MIEAGLDKNIHSALDKYVGTIMANSIIKVALSRIGITFEDLNYNNMQVFLDEIINGAKFYFKDPEQREECFKNLREILSPAPFGQKKTTKQIKMTISTESDIVVARNEGRRICKEIGFPMTLQIKVATAISELTRNIVNYVGKGTVTITPIMSKSPGIEIIAQDNGAGIPNLDEIMEGRYISQRGLGLGLRGARELMDEFHIDTGSTKGTTITVRKFLR